MKKERNKSQTIFEIKEIILSRILLTKNAIKVYDKDI